MDIKRKAYQELLAWKNKKGHRPLIVEGLRQVGKSYLVLKFAKENYENVVVFDFRHNESLRSIFIGDLAVDDILEKARTLLPEAKFVPSKTCIVFEEINDCPLARTSLKSFYLDGRFDILATGSLLGVENYRRSMKVSIPTGYEEYLKLYPLDFEEFLSAFGTSKEAIKQLRSAISSRLDLPETYDAFFKAMMKRYMVIGGMPEAVIAFLESGRDYVASRGVQERLLRDYRADFGVYIDKNGNNAVDLKLQASISAIFDSIPRQLARDNDSYKFKFSEVGHGFRYSSSVTPIDWLVRAGLVLQVRNVNAIETPLAANASETSFKLFYADTGLLFASYPLSVTESFLKEELGSRKGAFFENLAAASLARTGSGLYYYANLEKHLEIDFLFETLDGILLIEEKSTNGKMAASRSIMENPESSKGLRCVKFHQSGFGKGSFFTSIPHYASPFFLEEEASRLKRIRDDSFEVL